MVPFFEDDDDPKKPRPVHVNKKRDGWAEMDEGARKDDDRDHHRHVHVTRC